MNINQIIEEANLLVPNELSIADKVMFLNQINQDFFNVVKIPYPLYFPTFKGQQTYVINDVVRAKNIDAVHVGVLKYRELRADTTNPLQNTYVFNDYENTITLNPPPYQDGLQGFMRYFYISVIPFSALEVNAVPESPSEYHWTYAVALASYIAHTQDDAVKASHYENQYKSACNVAAQNYAKEVTQ
jgi:hypothetical protein